MKRRILLLCSVFYVEGALLDREYLKRSACARNPSLSICQTPKEDLPPVEPPPLPFEATREAIRWAKNSREKDELSDLNSQISQEYRKEKQGPASSGDDVAVLRAKCMRIAPVVQKHCEKSALTKANVPRCAAYFKDCSGFFGEADPLYSIANAFSSAVRFLLLFPQNRILREGLSISVQTSLAHLMDTLKWADTVPNRSVQFWSSAEETQKEAFSTVFL
ncbi:unnamed protein product [Heligmosomoides polygyrus]|uniref:Secreted protein n=1 Tax=Heligmosomoides polygyrus TaxID=6339 RepID=A0A183GRA0_HELPZ|nr:unnamed protein product [Heligmosomoides polygyrus]